MSKSTNKSIFLVLSSLIASLSATQALAVELLQGRTITGAKVASNDPLAVMEYDPNLNITWLRDWNKNGPMNWSTAKTWAANLTVGAFGGWALPTTSPDGCGGYNCTNSPMGYMYYVELGNAASSGMNNIGPFQNVQTLQNPYYWTSTITIDPVYAWYFHTGVGFQSGFSVSSTSLYAVAVRPGDVAPVPESTTLAMFMTGLAGISLLRKIRS